MGTDDRLPAKIGAKGGLMKCWVGLSVQLLPGEKQAVRAALLWHDPLMSLHVFDPELGSFLFSREPFSNSYHLLHASVNGFNIFLPQRQRSLVHMMLSLIGTRSEHGTGLMTVFLVSWVS